MTPGDRWTQLVVYAAVRSIKRHRAERARALLALGPRPVIGPDTCDIYCARWLNDAEPISQAQLDWDRARVEIDRRWPSG